MITAGTKIDVSALAATREEMADVGKTTDLVDITANRVEDEQEDVDKKVEQSSFSFTGGFSSACVKKINVAVGGCV